MFKYSLKAICFSTSMFALSGFILLDLPSQASPIELDPSLIQSSPIALSPFEPIDPSFEDLTIIASSNSSTFHNTLNNLLEMEVSEIENVFQSFSNTQMQSGATSCGFFCTIRRRFDRGRPSPRPTPRPSPRPTPRPTPIDRPPDTTPTR